MIELASPADLIWQLTVELRRGRSFAEDTERKASRIVSECTPEVIRMTATPLIVGLMKHCGALQIW